MTAKKTEKQRLREFQADSFMDDGFSVWPPSSGVDANWHVVNGGDSAVAHCFGFNHSVEQGEALAVRIAAALNYCRDLKTEHLLAHAAGTMQGRRKAD
jgi:hypothetical protein